VNGHTWWWVWGALLFSALAFSMPGLAPVIVIAYVLFQGAA
jgi:hypothetical protein